MCQFDLSNNFHQFQSASGEEEHDTTVWIVWWWLPGAYEYVVLGASNSQGILFYKQKDWNIIGLKSSIKTTKDSQSFDVGLKLSCELPNDQWLIVKNRNLVF